MKDKLLNTIDRIYPTNKYSEEVSNNIRQTALDMLSKGGYSDKEIMKVIGVMVSKEYITAEKEVEPLIQNEMTKSEWVALLYSVFLLFIAIPSVLFLSMIYPPLGFIAFCIIVFCHFEFTKF